MTLPRDLLPGRYQLAVGLNDTDTWFAPNIALQITPSTRIFDPPELQHTLNVDFWTSPRSTNHGQKTLLTHQHRDRVRLRLAVNLDSQHQFVICQ